MKCTRCQKKISVDHYLATTRLDSQEGNVQLVFKCDCGFYMVPFDLVQIGNGKGLIFSGRMKHCKTSKERLSDGKKLSREGSRIYHKHGEQAYEQWTREVFLPLMEAKLKKLRACTIK